MYSYVHIIRPGHDLKLTAGHDNVNSPPHLDIWMGTAN